MANRVVSPDEGITNGSEKVHHDHYDEREATLTRMRTAGSVSISAEMFERLYLSPQNKVKGELRKTFANPTPVAIIGFLISLTPLSMVLMGWRGSGNLGISGIATYIWFGGLLEILAAIGEWILGNTFPTIVFMTFGAFWTAFGCTLVPGYGAFGAFSTDPATAPYLGLSSPQFAASFAFFLVAMGIVCVIFMFAALRTNVIFFLIFFLLIPSFGLLAGAFWNNALGNTGVGMQCQIAAGAILLVIAFLGWYLFTALVFLSVDFPLEIPLGDLSTVFKGKSDREKSAKEAREDARLDEGQL